MKVKVSFVCGSQTPNGLGEQHNLFGTLVHSRQPQPARLLLLFFSTYKIAWQSLVSRSRALSLGLPPRVYVLKRNGTFFSDRKHASDIFNAVDSSEPSLVNERTGSRRA